MKGAARARSLLLHLDLRTVAEPLDVLRVPRAVEANHSRLIEREEGRVHACVEGGLVRHAVTDGFDERAALGEDETVEDVPRGGTRRRRP